MFLSKYGEYEPCNIYTKGHFFLIAITMIVIAIALGYTIKKKKDVKKIIRACTVFLWICEVIVITFKIKNYGLQNVNGYVPLYYCSLLLYSGILSGFCKGKLQRIGDVFLATGAIVGGLTYIIYPSTSLPSYPIIHLISIHSFTFHGIMIYLGLLVNITNYIKLEKKDFWNYSILVGITCALALIINNIFDSNLMFISKNFPGMILEVLYNISGRFFTASMILIQITLPFFVMKYIIGFTRKMVKNG